MMNTHNDIFLVRTGLKWTCKSVKWLANRLGVDEREVHFALSGNNRKQDRELLRKAYAELQNELDRQCAAARAMMIGARENG